MCLCSCQSYLLLFIYFNMVHRVSLKFLSCNLLSGDKNGDVGPLTGLSIHFSNRAGQFISEQNRLPRADNRMAKEYGKYVNGS